MNVYPNQEGRYRRLPSDLMYIEERVHPSANLIVFVYKFLRSSPFPHPNYSSIRVRVIYNSTLTSTQTMTEPAFSLTKSRAQFPALQQSHQIYFDNAGGSQVLNTVSSSYAGLHLPNPHLYKSIESHHHPPYLTYLGAFCHLFTRLDYFADIFPPFFSLHSIKSYLEETNVQLGATYNVAKQSTEIHEKGLAAAAAFVNAEPDEVGSSISPPPPPPPSPN